MGWLSGWSYRKFHVINPSSGAGINYQIKIVAHYGGGSDSGEDVYLNGKCRTDFGDVRFTGDDGTTLLDYWMQEKVDSDYAVFWIEIADDLSTNSATIYIYYGKADATTTSNFDNTFIFGDPFDSPTLDSSRWTSVDGNPSYTIDASQHYLEITNMDANNWFNGKGLHSRTDIVFPDSYIVEDAYSSGGCRISWKADANGDIYGSRFIVDDSSWSGEGGPASGVAFGGFVDAWSGDANFKHQAGVGENLDYATGTLAGSVGSWYNLYVKIYRETGKINVELNDVLRVSESNTQTPDRVHLGIFRYSTYTFGNVRFYAFKIRKYVDPEPSHGVWGSEEIFTLIERFQEEGADFRETKFGASWT